MMGGSPLLSVEHLTMRFGGLTAINDLSFDANAGEITAIIGPNGAGKTTVFNCLTGFYKPTVGRLTLRQDKRSWQLERLDDHRIASEAGVARTFQNIRIFPQMSVLENLIVAQHTHLMRMSGCSALALFGIGGYRRAEKEAVDLAAYWLDKVSLTDRADEDAGGLPYGAQRRLEIARAMCMRPALLCLDEPAAGLNPRETAELNGLLEHIKVERGTGMLLIEHDMRVVMEISDHVIVLDYGRKISEGTPETVRRDPAVIRAYIGEMEDAQEGAAP